MLIANQLNSKRKEDID